MNVAVENSFMVKVNNSAAGVVLQMRYFPGFVASNYKIESLPTGLPEATLIGKLDGVPVNDRECTAIRGSILSILDWCLEDVDSEILYKMVPYKAIVVRGCQYEVEIVSDRTNAPVEGIANLFHLLYPTENYSYAYDVKVTVTKARTWSANYKPIDNFEGDLSQFDLDKFPKPQTPKANNHYRVTPVPIRMAEPALRVQVEPKGYTAVGTDIDGNSDKPGNPEDIFASIMAEAAKHVNNVREGNTPALKIENTADTVKISVGEKEAEQPSKEAIDKYVKNSMEEAKDALAEKMRQSLQEARDEGMNVSTAQRGDAVAEDDFDFEKR